VHRRPAAGAPEVQQVIAMRRPLTGVQCPRIIYTDLDTSWLLAEWHEVKTIKNGNPPYIQILIV
jgi:hypothetical protein